MSRSNSSLGKLTSPSPRNKPRATSSAIPVPLYQLGRSPSSSSAGSVASFSPDLIVTEDEGEEMFFQRGPMPSPLIERRRESMRIMNQQMVDEGFRWKVMVSYCWDDVNLPCDPRKIAQHLSDAGLSTWLDIERLDSRKAVFPQLVDGILRCNRCHYYMCLKAWSRSPICNKEFRLISQLKVPVLIVQIGETRPGCWKRIGRVTLQNPGVSDCMPLDMILSETRWLVSRTLSTPNLPFPKHNLLHHPFPLQLVRSSSSSSSHSSTSTLTSSHATTIVSPSPSPSPSIGHSDLTGSALFHHFQANTPSPLSQKSSASPNDLPGVVALKRHADRGDAMSQFRLGVLSDAGIGVNPSSTPSTAQHSPAATAAFKWFSSAAERAHRDANYRLGNLFERGRGVNKDLEKAKRFYEVAFEMGDPDAGCALAGVLRELAKSGVKSAHEESRSSPPPEERWSDHAVGILERSATLGSIRSMFRLGIAMHDRKNHALAVDWFLRAAEEGDDGGAMFNLGTLSERGRGCRKSLSDAAKYYAMAADHRFDVAAAGGLEHAMASVHAVFNLGVFYEHGWGVEKDLKKCVDMYKEAATYGHRRGQFNYGVWTPKNLEDAVKWFIKAGEQGHPDAQFNLGNSYKYGEGVEKDLKEAARWYQKASEQGHSKAQFNLALCYDEGEGIEKNPEEAARLYKLSAEAGNAISQFYYGTALEQGRAEAQFMLACFFERVPMGLSERPLGKMGDMLRHFFEVGCAFESGWGVVMDFEKAGRWFARAAKAGHPKAAQRIVVGRN
ncbi:hypothetical protein BC829DRAFT_398444 [Chytridium lagenaria]|nr:hypothetical protein BC829DRAFT_398444 [Chytridium lagenaria]